MIYTTQRGVERERALEGDKGMKRMELQFRDDLYMYKIQQTPGDEFFPDSIFLENHGATKLRQLKFVWSRNMWSGSAIR